MTDTRLNMAGSTHLPDGTGLRLPEITLDRSNSRAWLKDTDDIIMISYPTYLLYFIGVEPSLFSPGRKRGPDDGKRLLYIWTFVEFGKHFDYLWCDIIVREARLATRVKPINSCAQPQTTINEEGQKSRFLLPIQAYVGSIGSKTQDDGGCTPFYNIH